MDGFGWSGRERVKEERWAGRYSKGLKEHLEIFRFSSHIPSRFLCFNLAKEQFVQDALNYHNERRQAHGAPLLKLNAELTKEAEKYAATLSTKSLKHAAATQPQGETIYMTCDGPVTGRSVGEAWYEMEVIIKATPLANVKRRRNLCSKKKSGKKSVYLLRFETREHIYAKVWQRCLFKQVHSSACAVLRGINNNTFHLKHRG